MFGADVRSTHEAMKAKALAASITTKLIKGDSTSEPREFDGLQARIPFGSAQLLTSGTTDNGDALSLFKLDQLIGLVSGPNKQLWMCKTMIQRITQAARLYTVGGFVTWTPDQFGRQIAAYNGVPMVEPYPENDGTEPLAFDEAGDVQGTPAGSSSTSIYCVSLGDGYLSGIQNGIMQTRDLGEDTNSPFLATRVEWLVSLVAEHPRCIARLGGIANTAVAA